MAKGKINKREFIRRIADNDFDEHLEDSWQGRIAKAVGALFGKDIILKQSRSKIPRYVMQEDPDVRGQPHSRQFHTLGAIRSGAFATSYLKINPPASLLKSIARFCPRFKETSRRVS